MQWFLHDHTRSTQNSFHPPKNFILRTTYIPCHVARSYTLRNKQYFSKLSILNNARYWRRSTNVITYRNTTSDWYAWQVATVHLTVKKNKGTAHELIASILHSHAFLHCQHISITCLWRVRANLMLKTHPATLIYHPITCSMALVRSIWSYITKTCAKAKKDDANALYSFFPLFSLFHNSTQGFNITLYSTTMIKEKFVRVPTWELSKKWYMI